MLLRYLLCKSLQYACIAYCALIVVLACGDLLIRLATLPSLAFIPALFACMVPLVSLFAMPIAAGVGVFIALGRMFEHHEWLFFLYSARMQRMVFIMIALFSCAMSFIFIPLVFEWAPKSYWNGKQLLVQFATEHINKLSCGEFHHPLPGAMLFFTAKRYFTHMRASTDTLPHASTSGTTFLNIMFMYQDKEGTSYLVIAKEGHLIGASLTLMQGTIQRLGTNAYRAHFAQSCFHLDRLIEAKPNATQSSRTRQSQMKYLTMHELWKLIPVSIPAYIELHVRITRILWIFCMPFFAYVGLRRFGILGSNNMVLCITIVGLLFLISYISITASGMFMRYPACALTILYGTLALSGAIMYMLGSARRSY